MSAFDDAMAAIYGDDNMGRAATYTPVAGDPVAVTVVLDAPDATQDFGGAGVQLPAYVAEVRLAEVAAPRRGDALTVAGLGTFKVARAKRDDLRLVAVLDLEIQP